jgi:hypothetical protein
LGEIEGATFNGANAMAKPATKQGALSSTAAFSPPPAKETPTPSAELPASVRGLRLVDIEGLAAIIGCTPRHAQNIYLSGHIRPVAGLGRLIRFSPAEITRFTNRVLSGEIAIDLSDESATERGAIPHTTAAPATA